MKQLLLSWILLLAPLACAAQESQQVHVSHIIDGDTFVTSKGDHIRLLGINTPEKASPRRKAEPFSSEATADLSRLIADKDVKLVFDTHKHDRYRRLLAHVYLSDGTWVNRQLVADGVAHVYTFPDNRSHIAELLSTEQIARDSGKGLWSLPRWQTRTADDTFKKSEIGRFYIVRGTVKSTATVRDTTYLNFGDDWRTDFTAEILPDAQPMFAAAGIDPLAYQGKRVEVRGIIKPVNGIMISVSHPEQIQILESPPATQ